jgi:ATP-binding cassette, subfamily B, multidrug efflux pump
MTVPATQSHEDDVLGKAYDRKLMRRLLVYTRPYRGLMYGAFALLCVEGGVQVVGPLLTRRVIDVAVPAHDVGVVMVSTALLLLALIAEFVTSYGQTWLTSLLGQRVMRDLRMEIFEHL